MKQSSPPVLSIVVPVYNEAAGITDFHHSLVAVLTATKLSYEIIYCNDGSSDDSLRLLKKLATRSKQIRIVSLSRNFGKEMATTAGLHIARGEAIVTIDADGQHPVKLLPKFIARWQKGSQVVVGVRTLNRHTGLLRRWASSLFYRLVGRLTNLALSSGATDYRLIDRTVQTEFKRMTEHNRITRGLIDWLGYSPTFIAFTAERRLAGEATYSIRKLSKLAIDSIISLSLTPLYVSAYLGVVVLPLALVMFIAMIADDLTGDPLNLNITGTAYVSVGVLFLVGIVLMSQGIIGLYLSHIHSETQNRPLYIIDKANSVGINEN